MNWLNFWIAANLFWGGFMAGSGRYVLAIFNVAVGAWLLYAE